MTCQGQQGKQSRTRTECGGVVVELPQRTQGMLVICKLHKGQATAAGLAPGIAPVWISEDLDLQAKHFQCEP